MKKYLIGSCVAIFGFTPIFFRLNAYSYTKPVNSCVLGELYGEYNKIEMIDPWKELIPDIEERKNLSAKVFKINECGGSIGNGNLSIEFIRANSKFKFVRIIRDEYSKFNYNNSNITNSNPNSRVLTYSTVYPNMVIFGDYPKTDTMYDFFNFRNFYLDYIYTGNRSIISFDKLKNDDSDIRICIRSYQSDYCIYSS